MVVSQRGEGGEGDRGFDVSDVNHEMQVGG